jgi:DNA-binding HxlR family transcriptional regulator
MAGPYAAAAADGGVRAGSHVLALFENPLNARVLRAHLEGPLRLNQLQEKIGRTAQTTVRAAVTQFCRLGALEKRSAGASSYASTTELTRAGRDLLFVADEVDVWLRLAPQRPIDPGSEAARVAVKGLAGGWSSTLMRALAGRSFTLTELAELIPGVSYPALERRVALMRGNGQIEPVEKKGRGTPYRVTDWLRHSIAPLCAAGRWERWHLAGGGPPVTDVEVEASFLLVLPLVALPPYATGTCMLAAQTDSAEPDSGDGRPAGVNVEVARGEVVMAAPEIDADPMTWAVGAPSAWFDFVIDGRVEDLRIGGANPQLALDLAAGLHLALFGLR